MLVSDMKTKFRYVISFTCLVLLLFVSACSSVAYKPRSAAGSMVPKQKNIVIFFDGTRNNEVSDTNVKKLHSLVELQARSDLATLYIEGVGNGEDIIGAVTGSGIRTRVEIAYEFLLQNYEEGDRIYLFGFSRGAYAAQMLNSLLYHAGIVKYEALSTRKLAELVYASVKEDQWEGIESERVLRTQKKLIDALGPVQYKPATVEILGLWDTVGALGVTDRMRNALHRLSTPYALNVDVQNLRHGVKLCNVKRVLHALSIDDNREVHFTPLLLGRTYAFDACVPQSQVATFENPLIENGQIRKGRLQEVWFAGAHADVGGGYPDSLSSGVSLNWMIEQINAAVADDRKYSKVSQSILPFNARVPEDIFGTHHDPRQGWWKLLYSNQKRNIAGYLSDVRQRNGLSTVCIHDSVVKRRLAIGRKPHENDLVDFREPGKYCFKKKTDSGTTPPQLVSMGKHHEECDKEIKIEVFPHCGSDDAK